MQGLDQLEEDERGAFFTTQRAYHAENVKYAVFIVLVVTLYYMFASGFRSPQHTFVRVNNVISLCAFTFMWVIRVGLRDRWLPLNRWTRLLDEASLFAALSHYIFYISLTWKQVRRLMDAVTSSQLPPAQAEEGLAESYCVLYLVLAIFTIANFHVVSTPALLVYSVYAPMVWLVCQVVLGSNLNSGEMIQVLGVFCVLTGLAFAGGRRNNVDHLNNYLRLHMERLQTRRIFREANVPIFIVGRGQSGSSSDLCVELWNTAMEELTQSEVQSGTPLASVACLRSSSTTPLLNAIHRALGKSPVRTQKILVPVVARGGVVWLQVDTSPMSSDGSKAFVIGSDVTEFVSRHLSLLHFVPEEGLGEQSGGPPGRPREEQRGCSAELDPHSFAVVDCSPGFSVMMQQQMRGKPLLSSICERDRNQARRALEEALGGNGPQKIYVGLCLQCACSDLAGRPPRRPRTWRENRSTVVRKVSLVAALTSDSSERPGALQVQFSSEVDTGDAIQQRSDPGVDSADILQVQGLMQGCARAARSEAGAGELQGEAACSEDGEHRSSRGGTSEFSPLAASRSALRVSNEQQLPPQAQALDVPTLDAVIIHLVDLARHFNLETWDASEHYLQMAAQGLHARCHELRKRFGAPCRHWRCKLCNGSNDEEDDICEICKLGEPDSALASGSDASCSIGHLQEELMAPRGPGPEIAGAGPAILPPWLPRSVMEL